MWSKWAWASDVGTTQKKVGEVTKKGESCTDCSVKWNRRHISGNPSFEGRKEDHCYRTFPPKNISTQFALLPHHSVEVGMPIFCFLWKSYRSHPPVRLPAKIVAISSLVKVVKRSTDWYSEVLWISRGRICKGWKLKKWISVKTLCLQKKRTK